MQSKHPLLCILILFAAVFCTAQDRDSQAEAHAACAISIEPVQLTPYGFAKAVLDSLWYGRNAAERGNEIKQVSKETDNYFSWMTAMMRIDKASTNDFICAKDQWSDPAKTAHLFFGVFENKKCSDE